MPAFRQFGRETVPKSPEDEAFDLSEVHCEGARVAAIQLQRVASQAPL
jgi:hypothetical protein